MKTKFSDFLLSGTVIFFLLILSVLTVKYLLVPATVKIFDNYHVIVDFFLLLMFYGLYSTGFLRLLLKIKPFSPGEYSMDDQIFTYWKLYTVIYEIGRGALLPFTTVFAKPLLAKMSGAQVGKDTAIGGVLVDPQLIRIGDETVIGQDTVITAHIINSGSIILKPVMISSKVTIGVNSVVMAGVEIGDNSIIAAGSVVIPDTVIPASELWGGIPAKKIKSIEH